MFILELSLKTCRWDRDLRVGTVSSFCPKEAKMPSEGKVARAAALGKERGDTQ
jgi:hypothetical protein